LVASDGVWDTLDNDEAAVIVSQALLAHGSAEEAARTLVRAARGRGSEDDITALVLWFTQEDPDQPALVTM
jgi:protein phosphatase 2C family protein 2/3